MYPIIDFRNGRYQGQTKNQLPDGVGILIDKNQLFCIAEWTAGEIKGPATIFFPSGRVFSGHIAYKLPEALSNRQLAEDHVQLLTLSKPNLSASPQRIAAVLPLQRTIFQIDNSNPSEVKVIRQYPYSTISEQENFNSISSILNLDQKQRSALKSYSNCLNFMQEYFARKHEDIVDMLINEKNNKKEYFFGLRGGGLGIKIEPLEELTLDLKQTGKVYLIRGQGTFTKENQMKDIGLKMIDNAMKGIVIEEGIFNLPDTVIKYEIGKNKRPRNCLNAFSNHLKRSLHYRDKIISTDYLYKIEEFSKPFNKDLRKIEVQKIAQNTIEKPNNTGENLIAIQELRLQKEREKEAYLKTKKDNSFEPNPYNPNSFKYTNPVYNLQRAADQIYRSASKRRKAQNQLQKIDYNKVQYIDPKFNKIIRQYEKPLQKQKQTRNYPDYTRTNTNINYSQPYNYQSDKDYSQELNDYYNDNRNKYKYSPERYQNRSPERRTSKSRERNRSYKNKKYSPERNQQYSPERRDGYLPQGRGKYSPERRESPNRQESPSRRYTDRYEDSKEYAPYLHQDKVQERNYRPVQQISHQRSRSPPRQKYNYYFDTRQQEPDYRDYSDNRSGSPQQSSYKPYNPKRNLRKKILRQNNFE